MKMTMTIGLVLLAVASTPRWAAAQSTQEIVDQFFPAARLTLEDAEDKRSCFAVYDTTASGAPATIVAGYTNTTVGVVRVLTRNSDDTFSVAAENAPTWTLIGYTCEVALTDVDGVAGSEIW